MKDVNIAIMQMSEKGFLSILNGNTEPNKDEFIKNLEIESKNKKENNK